MKRRRPHIRASRAGRCRAAGGDASPRACRRAARRPARSRRLLRAGRAVSAALVAADDGHPGSRGRRRGGGRRVSASGRRRCSPPRSRPASRGSFQSAARMPSRRWPTARDGAARRQDRRVPATAGWPRPRRSSRPTAASTSTPARPRSSSSRAGPADWIAADLIAQAEHDPDARAVLITPSRALAARVAAGRRAHARRRTGAWRAPRARRHHRDRVVDEAIELANAPRAEHLVVDDEALARGCVRGSLFVGPWSAQVAGDYAIGSNHVLPTAGAARVRGGLSAADFVRQITVQRLTSAAWRASAPTRSSRSPRPRGSRPTRTPRSIADRAPEDGAAGGGGARAPPRPPAAEANAESRLR
jgi:hypothetical protein